MFSVLSEFWKRVFLSPPNMISKSGLSEFCKSALQMLAEKRRCNDP